MGKGRQSKNPSSYSCSTTLTSRHEQKPCSPWTAIRDYVLTRSFIFAALSWSGSSVFNFIRWSTDYESEHMHGDVVALQILRMELQHAQWFGEQMQDYVGVLLLETHRRRNSSRMQHAGHYDLAPCQHVTLFLSLYREQTCLAEHFSPMSCPSVQDYTKSRWSRRLPALGYSSILMGFRCVTVRKTWIVICIETGPH